MQTLSGNWEGYFTYGEHYPEKIIGKSVRFYIELEEKDGYFKGFCKDENLPGHTATIAGFIDDTFISFVKRYPFALQMDEEGNSCIDPEKPPHDIHYSGNLLPDGVEGVFEFGNLPSFVHSEEVYEGGPFKMIRVTS